jgi:hypothetical protein
MLTNIYIASPSDAESIGANPASPQWPRLEFNGLDNAALAALLAALGNSEEAKNLEGEEYLVFFAGKGGPWVFHLPEVLRNLLSKLQHQEVEAVAEKWVKQEELAFNNLSASDVTPLIETLRDFAKQALNSHQQLMLWMSL